MEKLTIEQIRSKLNSIQSYEMNQDHFRELGKSSEIALIETNSELYKKFEDWEKKQDNSYLKTLYLTGHHKDLIVDTMIKHYDNKIEEKRKIIKDGL